MQQGRITTSARKNTFMRVIADAIKKDNMNEIANWIHDHVILKDNASIDQDAVDVFKEAQITLCQSFLRRKNTDSIEKLLGVYKKFKEPSVHELELDMIKNVVKLELDADLLLESSKTFLKAQADTQFGLDSLSQDHIDICNSISKLLGEAP